MAPPEDVGAITAEYFRIRIWAAPFTLLGYAIIGVLFGLARVKTILWLQLLLNLSNGALNVTFVVGLGLGVPGVAWGTLIAQVLTTGVSVWILLRIYGAAPLLAALRDGGTWVLSKFRRLVLVNGFIFVRTIFLMTALALIMRVAADLGTVEMAASHVVTQYMMLMALGLDGFAHASEALAGAAWGRRDRKEFRRWVFLTGYWSVVAALAYALHRLIGLGNPFLTSRSSLSFMALVALILFARGRLVPAGNVHITINGERDVQTKVGGKLLRLCGVTAPDERRFDVSDH